MSRNQKITVSAGFLIVFALVAIWLHSGRDGEAPVNADGYAYEDHFQHAGEADSNGTLNFEVTERGLLWVYWRNDTTFVQTADGVTHARYPTPQIDSTSFEADLVVAHQYFWNMQPGQFYSFYKFPNGKMECWPGKTPGAGNLGPYVDFKVYPVSGPAPLDVNFDARASYDPDGDLIQYKWRFGDGGESVGIMVHYVYQDPGNYLVTLTVSDSTHQTTGEARVLVNEGDSIPPPPPPPPPPPIDPDIVAYYPMEDTANVAVCSDGSGNDYHGTTRGGVTFSVDGKVGRCASFDQNGAIDLPAFDVPGDQLTICAWIYVINFAVYDARIISKATGVSGTKHYWMLSTYGNQLRGRLKTNGTTGTLISSSGTLVANRWHFVAMTYSPGNWRLWIDGTTVMSSADQTGYIDEGPSVGAAIGDQPVGAGDRPFYGKIDEVRVYSRALTAAEIQGIMADPN